MSVKIPLRDGKPNWPFSFRTWSEDVEDAEGTVPAAHIKRAIHYHFNPVSLPVNTYFREQRLSKNTLVRFGRKMAESVPTEYDTKAHPWDPYKRFPDPNCANCRGAGGRVAQIIGTEATDFIMGPCIIGPPEADDLCPKCRGTGSRDRRIPGTLYTEVLDCDCLR